MVSFSQAPPLPLTFALFTLHSFVFASALEANASICSVFALWSMGSSSTISLRISWATGIKRDQAAVKAALSLAWSQGQVEGQITRLKFLKRQMYGRARFELLRSRVLRRA